MTNAAPVKSPRHRGRKVILLLLLLLTLSVGGFYSLTRGFLGRWIIESILSAQVGARATLGGIHIHRTGRTELYNLRFSTPEVHGPAGTFFQADRLEVDLDTRNWKLGEIGLQAVAADGIVARISQDTSSGFMNIQSWRPPSQSSTGKLPRVVVRSGRIELCEHTGDRLTVLKAITVKGDVSPAADNAVDINFHEIIKKANQPDVIGMAVGGKLNPFGLELVLTNFTLSDWPPETIPSLVRPIYVDLQLSGEISRARLQWSFQSPADLRPENPTQGVAATLELKSVGVSLPGIVERANLVGPLAVHQVGAPETPSKPRLMRVQAEQGTLTFADGRTNAKLSGTVEGIPYTVRAIYQGTTSDAPYEAVFSFGEFALKKDSPVLRFATPLVLERLSDFGFPEGNVRAEVTLSREAKKDMKFRGEVRLSDGTAAFHRFPYRFHKLRARVLFNDEEVIIQRVEGEAPSGATIIADGRIAPPVDEAGVDVHVVAKRVPIDTLVEEALGPKRSKLIHRIFNTDRYNELIARGEIRRPPAPGQPPMNDPDAPPVFALGGVADIDVKVTRDVGPGEDPWHDIETIDISKAGLLPERFPFPLVADNVRAVINDGILRLDKVPLQGLRGGTAMVTAEMDARRRPDGVPDPDPTIHIEAEDFPIDRTLIQALPSREMDGRSARSIVSALGLTGSIDAIADISPGPNDDITVRVEVKPRKLEAIPLLRGKHAVAGEVMLRDLAGKIVVQDDQLSVDLRGVALSERALPPPVSDGGKVQSDPTNFELRADVDLTLAKRSDVRFHAAALDLSLPLEGVLGIFASGAGGTVDSLRTTYQPFGVVDVSADAALFKDRTEAEVSVSSFRNVRFTLPEIGGAPSAEVSTSEVRGTILIRPGDGGLPTSVEFKDFAAKVNSGPFPDGQIHLDGLAAMRMGVLTHPPGKPSSLTLDWKDAQVGSPLCRWIGAAVLGDLAGQLHDRHDPEGAFDLALRITPGGPVPDVRGEIFPKSLKLTMSDGTVSFNHITGRASFDRHSIRFEKAVLNAEKWSVTASGDWNRDASGRSEGTAHLAIDSLGIPADLVAAAPAGVCDALRDLKADATGKVVIPALEVQAWWDGSSDAGGKPDRLRASGKLEIAGGRADAGVEVTNADGEIDFTAQREGREAPLRYDLSGAFSRLQLSGIQITDGRVRVVGGEKPGETYVPLISGDCHGGRIAGYVSLFPTRGETDTDSRDFETRISFSGVKLGPLVDELRKKLSADKAVQGPAAPSAASEDSTAASAAKSDARLDVGITLAGTIGKPETRRGRGSASAGQGKLVSLPLLTRLAEASNLVLPLGEPLDLLQASFFVHDRTVSFEELSIFSSSVEFLGFGTLKWPDMNLDMVFTSRATNRMPIVGHIVEGLRNELVTTTVGGTIASPEFGVATMRGTRDFFGLIFGGSNDPRDRQMRELERRGQRGSERIRIESQGAR
ncbi:MAG: hypothetical protein U0573_09475 [Phycisphaerales bacterium]|nr:hypothetical protein [Planctomycetota bacterium]